jgi:hypothetical protein
MTALTFDVFLIGYQCNDGKAGLNRHTVSKVFTTCKEGLFTEGFTGPGCGLRGRGDQDRSGIARQGVRRRP